MNLFEDKNWFAVQAKIFRENFAAANVAGKGVEILLPKIKFEQELRASGPALVKPLFPGYFFARFSPLSQLDLVRYAPGVLRVVSSGNFPIPLDDHIIPAIQNRISQDGYVHLTQKGFHRGESVSVRKGPFEGLLGRVEQEWDDGKRVIVFLEAIEQARVLIEKRCLEHV